MSNNVVIGDLSKYNGNDVLKFDGVGDYATLVQLFSTATSSVCIHIKGEIYPTQSNRRLFGDLTASVWAGINNTLDGWYIKYGDIDTGTTPVVSSTVGVFDNKVTLTTTETTHTVNGVTEVYSAPSTLNNVAVLDILHMGGQSDWTEGQIYQIEITVDGVVVALYVQNGDFGSSTLVDHSGNGNHGTITGATWWKQGVDESFITPQACKSSWVIPMEQSQNVVYTDAEPYYATEDVFWNPYNQDLTYSFTVSQQSDSAGINKYIYSYSYSY